MPFPAGARTVRLYPSSVSTKGLVLDSAAGIAAADAPCARSSELVSRNFLDGRLFRHQRGDARWKTISSAGLERAPIPADGSAV